MMNRRGFTIVELLIVVVVIAILAAITIVAYNGIQNRAKDSAVAAQLSSAVKKVELAKVQAGDRYPTDISSLQLPTDGGTEYAYATSSDQSSYCLAVKKGTTILSSVNGGASLTGGCASVTAGALGWWPLNGDGADRSGNGRPLEMLAGMSAGVGQNGAAASAVSFTGSAQPTIPAIQLAGVSYSISGWMNVATFNHSGSYAQAPMLGARSTTGGTFTAMHFGVRAADSTSNPRVYMDYYGSGQPATTLLGVNSWHHLAYVYDAAANTRRFYLNGVQDALHTAGQVYRGVVDTIGYSCCMTSGLQGRLDDVRIYGRTLTAAEVTEIYTRGAQ